MPRFRLFLLTTLAFGFLTLAKADSTTLPKEFFDRADMYSKMDLIENLSIVENLDDRDLNVAEVKTDATEDADKGESK